MKIVLCSNREDFCKSIASLLKDEVEAFETLRIDNEIFDYIYKLNPDLIFFDLCQRDNTKWRYIENFTAAPSLRDIPLIVIIDRKIKSTMKKIFEYEIFDYIVGNFCKCELIMKINKARQIMEMKNEFNKLLTKDPLTGAFNRSFLMKRIEEEINWCILYKEPLSIAIFDIDHFKKLNDTYGHLTGDKILMEMVSLANNSLPTRFTLGRYGGEEFCIVMPSTGETEAFEICNEFRETVSKYKFRTFSGEEIHLTVSIGVTTFYGDDTVTAEEIIDKGDTALYRAKNTGRNRVILEPFVLK